MSSKESISKRIERRCNDLDFKIKGIVSCFCDTCKKGVECPFLGYQKIDTAWYELLLTFCNVCGQNKNLKCCTACKLSHYCSRECQIIDYPKHKRLCKRISKDVKEDFGDSTGRGDSMLYFYLGCQNLVWKGFLQLKKPEIKERLEIGIKLFSVVQFHDAEVRGASKDSLPIIETIQNNLKVLGMFTSFKSSREYQLKSAKSVLKKAQRIPIIRGQTSYYQDKFVFFKNGELVSINLGKKRSINFFIIPFIASPKNVPEYVKNKKLGKSNRVKMLLSYYWSDMHTTSCVKILEVFEDEKIGFQVAEEREKHVETRYEFKERELPTSMKNEERKNVGEKFSPDICHYDIIDLEVDKKYPPYVVYDELDPEIKKKITLLSYY